MFPKATFEAFWIFCIDPLSLRFKGTSRTCARFNGRERDAFLNAEARKRRKSVSQCLGSLSALILQIQTEIKQLSASPNLWWWKRFSIRLLSERVFPLFFFSFSRPEIIIRYFPIAAPRVRFLRRYPCRTIYKASDSNACRAAVKPRHGRNPWRSSCAETHLWRWRLLP